MTLDIGPSLTDGRRAAESRMTDACTIGVPTGTKTWDPNTETYTQPTTVDYAGKCRVKAGQVFSREEDAGATTAMVIRPSVHIPADVTGIVQGSIVTVTAAAYNPSLVGRAFRVSTVLVDSQATAQRLDCTEVQ